MEWAVIFEPANLALFGNGIVITLWLLFSSLAVGAVLALIFALLLTGPWAPLRWLVGAYTFVIRGTPLLIQVYLIYYGLGQLEWIQARWDAVWPWTYFKEPFFCALLAFSLNTAGYTAEMLAGAIRETSAGEIEAAHAYGMSRFQTMLRVVLPSAMRRLHHVDAPRINDNEPGPGAQPLLHARGEDRVAVGRIGADDDEGRAVRQIPDGSDLRHP